MHLPYSLSRRQLPGKPLPGIGVIGRLPNPLANALGRGGPAVPVPAVPAAPATPAVSTTPATSTTAAAANPCPQANGTSIGSVQQFTLLCGSVAGGDTLNTTTAASFDDCTAACASSHPKCAAVTFDGSLCTLKSDAAAAASANSNTNTNINSGLAQFPLASSDCASLTGPATSTTGAVSFDLFCNNVINGGDISQSNTATFQQCIDQCASTSGCAAITFDPAYTLGFKNCYLKGTSTGEQAPIVDAGLDSAVVRAASADGAAVSSAGTGSASSAISQGSGSNGVVTVPIASLSPTAATATSQAVAPTSIAGQTLATSSPSLASAIIATATGVPSLLPATSPFSTATATASLPGQDSIASAPGASNRAWIAAPVVGSLAAVTVVAVMFILWGRRRVRRSSLRMSLGSQDSQDRQDGRQDPQSQVAMAITTDSVERLSNKGKGKEKKPLRNSMNGLAQNQTSLNRFDVESSGKWQRC